MTASALKFMVVVSVFTLVQCVFLLIPSALRTNGHEADLLHLIDLALRFESGLRPHQDFMTPMGWLSYAPVTYLMGFGLPVGKAILAAFALAALVLLPFVSYVAITRLEGAARWLFGLYCMILMTSLVYGGDQATVSVSMFYNRWAWTIAFCIFVIILMPSRLSRSLSVSDGAILAILMMVLAGLKVTYLIAILPAFFAYLLIRRDPRLIATGVITAVILFGVMTVLMGGIGFWLAYANDLIAVSGSSVRAFPGLNLADTLATPSYLLGTLLAFFAVIFFRQNGMNQTGLVLLLCLPGFAYITYQNWGNDPKWLVLLAVLFLAGSLTLADQARQISLGAAVAALAISSPSIINMAYSPLRHLALPAVKFEPLLAEERAQDIHVAMARNTRVFGTVGLSPVPDQPEPDDPRPPTRFRGEVLPDCKLKTGLTGIMTRMTGAVTQALGPDRIVQVADLYDGLWLLGDVALNRTSAPWYYIGEAGFADADAIIVPLCPLSQTARSEKLDALERLHPDMQEVLRTPDFILLRTGT